MGQELASTESGLKLTKKNKQTAQSSQKYVPDDVQTELRSDWEMVSAGNFLACQLNLPSKLFK